MELWVQDGLPFFPESTPLKVLGYAQPERQHAFVERPGEDLDAWRVVLVHELTHLVIDRQLASASGFALQEALCDNFGVELLATEAARRRHRADWWLAALQSARRDAGFEVSVGVRVDPHAPSGGRVSWSLFRATFAGGQACPEFSIDELPVLEGEPECELMNTGARAFSALVLWRVARVHGWDDVLQSLRARPGEAGTANWNARWLALAGLPEDSERWLDALLTSQDASVVARRLIERSPIDPSLHTGAATLLAGVIAPDRRRFPEDDLAAWIRRREPRLEVHEFGLSTPIEEHPEFLAALKRVWDDPPPGVTEFRVGFTRELLKRSLSRR